MNNRIYLHDNWHITGYNQAGETVAALRGTVPGHVHTDLLREGLIPDPMWRDQANDSQWVEACDWVYETEFVWPAERSAEAAMLHFEGLDTIAAIYVNDELVGNADNMFIGHSFPVQGAIRPGSNRLKVHFTSIPTYMQDKEVGKYKSCFSLDRVFIRRMQCTFGWDWVNRLVSYGIWRPVYLDARPGGTIDAAWMRTDGLEVGSATMSWEVEAASREAGSRLSLQLVDPAGALAWEHEEAFGTDRQLANGTFKLDNPQLWWPIDYGTAHLYALRIRLLSPTGEVLDEREDEIGIRTAIVEQIPDEQGRSFTIVVNGQRIFAKGGNWVPADPFPSSVTKERYEELLQTLIDGHSNMIRVWGGGTYELPDFWKTCNRLGIMTSVDFMLACAAYPEDEQWFIDAMKVEAEAAIKELRNHPSLIFWSGDNELASNNNAEDDYRGKVVCALVTEPLTAKLDPSRNFFPTSPCYGRPFNSMDEGDCHHSSWYNPDFIVTDLVGYRELIVTGRGRFLSENAIPGAPPLSSLLKMMTMEDVADDDAAAIWEFRTKDNPYNGMDESHYRMLQRTAVSIFGESDDLLLRVKKLGYVQYEFIRLESEHYRRRKYPSSGVLFWMFNDCWPASGWSMIDYYGVPKAGYYGAKKAFKPLMVSLEDRKGEIGVWMVNDTLEAAQGEITIRSARTGGGTLYEERIETPVPANAAFMVCTLNKAKLGLTVGSADVVVQAVWQPKDEGRGAVAESQTVYIDVLPKELKAAPATLQVTCLPHDAFTGVIKIGTDVYARVVSIDEELQLDDNYFDIMPGESRTIAYRSKSTLPANFKPKVTCWNE